MQPILDKDEITLGGEAITLYELSALNRIRYLEFIAGHHKPVAEKGDSELLITTRLQAWDMTNAAVLVGLALGEANGKDLQTLAQQVMGHWSPKIIYQAYSKAADLAGFPRPEDDSAQGAEDDVPNS